MEGLRGHSTELGHIIAVNRISVDDCRGVGFFYRFLGDLNAVVDNKQRVVGSQNLVVQ